MGFELLKENVVHKAEVLGTPIDVTVPLMVRMPSAAGGMSFEEWRLKGYPKFTGKPVNLQALAALAAANADKKPVSRIVETTVEIVASP